MFKTEGRGDETRFVTKETLCFNGIIQKGRQQLCRARSLNSHAIAWKYLLTHNSVFFIISHDFMTFSEFPI